MKIKVLAYETYEVVAVVVDDDCPTVNFIKNGEESTRSAREGLLNMIERVAELGLQNVPSAWAHEANKKEQIFEFIKGPLRLFFFKGVGGQIAVCTTGERKKGQKTDKSAVRKAAEFRKEYFESVANKTVEVVNDETE